MKVIILVRDVSLFLRGDNILRLLFVVLGTPSMTTLRCQTMYEIHLLHPLVGPQYPPFPHPNVNTE